MTSTSKTGLSAGQKRALEHAAAQAISYREKLPDLPARPVHGPTKMAVRFSSALEDDGLGETEVIEELLGLCDGGIHAMAAPTFFGYVLGASHPVGVAADFLVSAWGQNSASSFESPAMAALEQNLCRWIIDLFSLPSESGAGLVTGGTVANTAGIMAARHRLLAEQDWDVEADGLFGAPEVPVLIGKDAHSAPAAALRYAGFGASRVRIVDTDNEGRIDPSDFEKALQECAAPPLVVLQAGQINTGAFDPFEKLIPLVHDRKGWVHVDGAFGMWLAAVPGLAPRLSGVQMADSWAIDLHKWLNAPFDAGIVITKERAPLVASMSARGAYLPDKTDVWEPGDSTPELSRRARGVPSYAILRHLGRSGVEELVSRHCSLAQHIAERLAAEPGLTVLNEIHSNQVAITCGEGAEGDALVLRVLERVQSQQRVYPSHGEWKGRKIIRASVIGYAMQIADADLLVDEIIEAHRWCLAQQS
ncbi:MAG: aminotransferase class V-fold PLP-dependent enzyme [Pseudomonadota bacterium]